MTEFESKCYGMSEDNIRDVYMQSLTARLSGLEMVVMSILDRKSTRLNSSHSQQSRMPSSA